MVTKKYYTAIREKYETKETSARRQNKRQQELESLALAAGWENWSQFVTALKKGVVPFPQRPVDYQSK